MDVISGKLVKSFLPLLGIIYVAWAFARQVSVKKIFVIDNIVQERCNLF